MPRFSPGAKERGQNNQRLSCAELSLGSTWTRLRVPPEPVEYSLPAKLLSPKRDGDPGAFFGPSQSQGGTWITQRFLFHQPNGVCQAELIDIFPVQKLSAVKSKGSKDVFEFFWLLSKMIPIPGTLCCPITCFGCMTSGEFLVNL